MLTPQFPHLKLIHKQQGRARLNGGGKTDPIVERNIKNRLKHSKKLQKWVTDFSQKAADLQQVRKDKKMPLIDEGAAFMLQIPANDEECIDFIAEKLDLEVVAEFDDGYLIVATANIELTALHELINEFSTKVRGSKGIANIKEIDPNPLSRKRLERILDPSLMEIWPIDDGQEYIFDVSIEVSVSGTPPKLSKNKRWKSTTQEKKEAEYNLQKEKYLQQWEDVRIRRESSLENFCSFYEGEILRIVDDSGVIDFPDSFSARIQMSGKGFKDLIFNHPNIFEILFPDDITLPISEETYSDDDDDPFNLSSPPENAGTICVIDSGIQEGHRWLSAAIDTQYSKCFIPNYNPNDTADYVRADGHGTRVAGAVLYPHSIPLRGNMLSPFWLLNARVLNEDNCVPVNMYPPKALLKIVDFYLTNRGNRLYVHSINSTCSCHINRMSAWACAVDLLSYTKDALFIQSTGNISHAFNNNNNPGILHHLNNGLKYGKYQWESSSRIANPAQSLQAITVGSITTEFYNDDFVRSVAPSYYPSSFTRCGFGLWDSIKPEVVEFGGDYVRTNNAPIELQITPHTSPELLRSTLYTGPAFARDDIGTSFAAPKVAHIAGHLQNLFPDRKTQLYRALIINSARWPSWAERHMGTRALKILRSIGYGVPSLEIATENTENRATLITDSDYEIKAKQGYIFSVPIPAEMRRAGDEFDVRIDITLSYTANPKRTRKSRRGYLGVWLDWFSCWKNENIDEFSSRMLTESASPEKRRGQNFQWMLGNKRENNGVTDGAYRKGGTVQKDWTVAKSHELPDVFGIAVHAHEGWERKNEDAFACFSLVVSFEALGGEVPVYETIKQAIEVETLAEVEIMN